MKDIFSAKAAREYASDCKIEEWIHRFLRGEGNNTDLSEGLMKEKRRFIGPVKLPLNLFERCCGPEDGMKFKVNEDGFHWRVSEILKRMENGWSMPPLIVNFSYGVFTLNDGNHRYEALTRKGVADYDVIIWMSGEANYQQCMDQYGKYIKP